MSNKDITNGSQHVFNEWERLETECDKAQNLCNELFEQNEDNSPEFRDAYRKFIATLDRWRDFENKNRALLFANRKKS